MKRLEAAVFGRVQGVSFRYHTQYEANRLGIVGWVANRFDGTVRVVAEGPEGSLRQFARFLHRGSPSAQVNEVRITWAEATREFKYFRIRYR